MKKILVLLGVCLGAVLWSCQKEDDSEMQQAFLGYQYAPLEVGQERVYQVDSIIYDDFSGTVDTISFQKKEVIEATFNDLEGKRSFRLKLFHRKNDTADWQEQFVFTELKNELRFERRLNNLPVIHLVFPIKENVDWNANALNTEAEVDYRYANLHQSFTYDSLQFDSTVTVLHREDENLIERVETYEKYAAQIGLIYRFDEEVELNIQNGEIESGYSVTVKWLETTSN